MSNFDLSAFFGQFREETEENVRSLTSGLLTLESQPADRGTLDGIFRAAHTIKGSARMLGQVEAARLSHAMESILGELRSGQLKMSPPLNDVLLASADVLLVLAAQVGEPPPNDERVEPLIVRLNELSLTTVSATPPASASPSVPPPVVAPTADPPPAPEILPPAPALPTVPAMFDQPARAGGVIRPTVRVPITRLDRLLNTTGELVVTRQTNLAHSDKLQDIQKLILKQERILESLLSTTLKLRGAASVRNDLQNFGSQLDNLLTETRGLLRGAIEQWGTHIAGTNALVDELEAEVMATRLQPIAGLFAPIPRSVRELARALSKEVALITEGETTEADRKVIEMLADPVLHLVRNALDHGIELPAERVAAGKPAEATLRISARSLGGVIELIIADDGRGIDPAVIRQTAVRRGLIEPDMASRLRDEEALDLIWQPGFTTSAMITDISGRGVGMDVVRTAVIEIGGRVEISSEVGLGTTFTLNLPITLLTTRVLLFEASGGMYALPSTACLGGRRVPGAEIQTIEGRPTIRLNERIVPVVALAPMLDQRGPLPLPSNISTLVILGPANRPLALLVDRLIDEREAVVKSLGAVLAIQRLCTGAVALPDGRLVLLLNPAAIIDRAREIGRPIAPAAPSVAPARLLVAEDSFTTRELLRSILQSAGYKVETANHGRDALDKLQSNPYDLVVSDVEMPHLNGFELTRHIRADQRLQNLPVIIITSLAREADRREGLLAGAQAYIVKSQFDQSNLLETIQQLLGR
ncbi:MAG: hybrid sensor histidine kinase/response regulator [Herpetosiphonaceae bacterium]|nr:hybrid sensor histidine kinase/response regulator [Herpetosiphonaceae bacterium]